jgi:hypothetical protein
MARSVFYSWQSDLPNNTNRALIRKSLDDALRGLNAQLLEPEREPEPELVVDQDTQGIPGSPAIADAILEKIRDCVAFVSDVSFVIKGERHFPNPNVLVEYGYALSEKGDTRILLVFNTEFGDVRDLPFDIRHKRVVSYSAPTGDGPEAQAARRQARKDLGSQLSRHLENMIAEEPEAQEPSFSAAVSVYCESCFVQPGELLGTDVAEWAAAGKPTDLEIVGGPHLFLRVIPTTPQPVMTHAETSELLGRTNLWPLGPRAIRVKSSGRNKYGAFTFSEPREFDEGDLRAVTPCFTEIFRTREIWGVDALSLSLKSEDGRFYVPCESVEELLQRNVCGYLRVARDLLEVNPPFRVTVGFSRVEGFRLAVGRSVRGNIMDNEIVHSSIVSSDEDALEVLAEFYRRYWDSAGLSR